MSNGAGGACANPNSEALCKGLPRIQKGSAYVTPWAGDKVPCDVGGVQPVTYILGLAWVASLHDLGSEVCHGEDTDTSVRLLRGLAKDDGETRSKRVQVRRVVFKSR